MWVWIWMWIEPEQGVSGCGREKSEVGCEMVEKVSESGKYGVRVVRVRESRNDEWEQKG